MMKIAISYRRTDESETLKMLVQTLKSRFGDENVYLDVGANRIGEFWMHRWAQAYISADCIIAIIGPQWSPERLQEKGDAVLLEVAGIPLNLIGWLRVIPVLIDGGKLPKRAQLPLAMWPLLTRHGCVIDPLAPAESIAQFVTRLERDRRPPSGWRKHIPGFRAAAPAASFDLTGEWVLESKPPLFSGIHIQQNRMVLSFWALGIYADEIVGEGFVAIERPRVSFFLMSKQYGAAGMLILDYNTKSDRLTGRWMPSTRPLLIAAFYRKKVSLKRTERNS